MLMDEETFRGAVNEVMSLYQDLCDHHRSNPDESEVLSQMFGTMLGVALDHFLHDIDNVNPYAVNVLFRRTRLSKEQEADLAREGLRPYQKPLTREDLFFAGDTWHDTPLAGTGSVLPCFPLHACLWR